MGRLVSFVFVGMLIACAAPVLGTGADEFELFERAYPAAPAFVQIFINEFLADPYPGSDWDGSGANDANDEWVELYNPNGFDVDLSGWTLEDDAKAFDLDGMSVPAGGYLVVFKANSSISLNNGGENIWLKNETGVLIDHYRYYASRDDCSQGRRPDGSARWTSFFSPTPNSTNGQWPDIVINEVQYDAWGSDTDTEWVELFNNGPDENLTEWIFTTQDSDYFYLPEVVIPNGSYLVLSTGPGVDELDFSDGAGIVHLDTGGAVLTNTGDDVLLMDLDSNGVDYMAYGRSTSIDRYPADLSWDGTFYNYSSEEYDGACENPNATIDGKAYGNSVALLPNGLDTDSVTGWAGVPEANVTRGRDNSKVYDLKIERDDTHLNFNSSQERTFGFRIVNTGSMADIFNITILDASANWSAMLNLSSAVLGPGDAAAVGVQVKAPDDPGKGNVFECSVFIGSMSLPLINTTLTFTGVIPVVDLAVGDVELSVDGEPVAGEVMEGHQVRAKVFISNTGKLNSGPFNVTFSLDGEVFETRNYTYCWQGYDKHPSVYVDTMHLSGNHTLGIHVDAFGEVEELSEENNIAEVALDVVGTSPPEYERAVVFTKVYYYCRGGFDDEFVEIFNTGGERVNISGWRITDLEGEAVFPDDVVLEPGASILVTRDADDLFAETGWTADFEYGGDNDRLGVPGMSFESAPYLANSGDEVFLTTEYGHIIDCFVWGSSSYSGEGWSSATVSKGKYGYYVQRQNVLADTNTSADWDSYRKYGLGQTDMPVVGFTSSETVCLVQPDCGVQPLMELIGSANKSIKMSGYTLKSDVIAGALENAAKNGVEVDILLEGGPVGGIEDVQHYITGRLVEAGADVRYMVSNTSAGVYARYSYLHAKYIIVDDSRVLVGSENFGGSGYPSGDGPGNRGWAVILDSAGLASALTGVFLADSSEDKPDITTLNGSYGGHETEDAEGSYYNNAFTPLEAGGKVAGELWLGPDNSVEAVAGLMASADSEVLIQQMDLQAVWEDGKLSPHIEEVFDAAGRGVDVKVLLDSAYVEFWSPEPRERRAYSWYLNRSGLDTVETVDMINAYALENGLDNLEARLCYLGGLNMVHNKGVVVDGEKVLVSSMNWNQHSFTWNREAGVMLDDADCAQYYKEAFLLDWDRSPSTLHAPGGPPAPLLITSVYYDSNLLNEPNEFVSIHNPSEVEADLGGSYITDQQSSYSGFEATVVFPRGTVLQSGGTVYVTKDAGTFRDEMGFLPDYEYEAVSGLDVVHIDNLEGDMKLSNDGDELFLKDKYHRILDMVCWEGSAYSGEGWTGSPCRGVPEGKILTRFRNGSVYLDTDSRSDWESVREQVPGQSAFEPGVFDVAGNITAFVSPDCTYSALTRLLKNATSSVYLNVYQFHNIYLMNTLVNLSSRGVDVKVLLDGDPVGGLTDAGKYIGRMLSEAGVDVRYWISDRSGHIFKRYRYDHAKYCIVDNETVAVMSENWKLSGVPVEPDYGNRGWGIIVEDEHLAGSLLEVFLFDFNPLRNDTVPYDPASGDYGPPPADFQPPEGVPSGDYYPRFAPLVISTPARVTPVVSPDTSLHPGTILGAIGNAEDYICVQQLSCELDWIHGVDVALNWSDPLSDYLEWEDGQEHHNLYLSGLIDAARRGVRVRVLLDSSFIDYDDLDDNDNVVHYLNELASLEGLDLEAKLYYQGNVQGLSRYEIIHNKGMIVDGGTVLVSSINWVVGSVGRNREMGLLIENPEVAGYYQQVFEFDWGMDLAEYIRAQVLYSDVHTVENGTDTGFPVLLENTGEGPITLELETIWLGEFAGSEDPGGFSAMAGAGTVELLPGETREVVLRVSVPESVNETLEQTVGLRLRSGDALAADIVFMTIIVKNGSQLERASGSGEDRDGAEAGGRSQYAVPAVLGIVILAMLIILIALIRDKLREPGKNGEDEEE